MPRPRNLVEPPIPFAARTSYSIRDFCTACGLCRATFYNLVARGQLTPVKAGGRTLILRAEMDRWLASLPSFRSGRGATRWPPLRSARKAA
jgi:predicted DNA-binding transcriptional regulator AlpA